MVSPSSTNTLSSNAAIKNIIGNIDSNTLKQIVLSRLAATGKAGGGFVIEKSHLAIAFAMKNPRKLILATTLSVIGIASGPIVAAILSSVGFSTKGVVAGSLAATWQASIGNVSPGSLFSLLQSTTAAGNAATIGQDIGISIAAMGLAAMYIRNNEQLYGQIKQVGDQVGRAATDIGNAVAAYAKDNEHVLQGAKMAGKYLGEATASSTTRVRDAAVAFAKDNENVLVEIKKAGRAVGGAVDAFAKENLDEDTLEEVKVVGGQIGRAVGSVAAATATGLKDAANPHVQSLKHWINSDSGGDAEETS